MEHAHLKMLIHSRLGGPGCTVQGTGLRQGILLHSHAPYKFGSITLSAKPGSVKCLLVFFNAVK